ncbi:MAG: RluA family pseudouridine synthase [Patescibacteria group bacterium]
MNSPRLVYADEEMIVLDKPVGWLTHADGRTTAPCVTDWLVQHFPEVATVGEMMKLETGELIARPGVVHRLDRGTSGVLVVARTVASHGSLKAAFAARQVKKSYRLLVHGVVKKDEGLIDAPIGRSKSDPRVRVVTRLGRAALTRYRVLERFAAHTYLEAYPETGRTHQLRVHFKSIQHPILGDTLYISRQVAADQSLITRPALHAFSLELPSRLGRPHLFIAPLPVDFFRALASLQSI